MSLRLILMRNAKTELKTRLLTNRGQKTCELIGKSLSNNYWIPTKVLFENQIETKLTWKSMEPFLQTPKEINLKRSDLLESWEQWISEIENSGNDVSNNTVLLITQNPICTEILERLTGHLMQFPTGMAGLLERSNNTWRLVDVLVPKEMK